MLSHVRSIGTSGWKRILYKKSCLGVKAKAASTTTAASTSAKQATSAAPAVNAIAGPPMVQVFINNMPVEIEAGSAVIQACAKAGIDIPRFCYHERLAIAGNCRMCLVEVEKSPKPVASCAMPVAPGMRVWTDSDQVKKDREGVMEFLLANHPLDCPICDQGGECDLQDQAMAFGADRGRFGEGIGKRAVEDKDFGPLVKTTMTRCIHCTRCVRFAIDVAGMDELGTSGRGNDMQIGTYVAKVLDNELSGNIIDLCPVGALTSKPYEFKARPWELKKTESIDVMDAVGSNIRVDSRGQTVHRILPRLSEDINEEWLADKSRFACDGLSRQRLTRPLLRTVDGNGFVEISWEKAFGVLLQQVQHLKSLHPDMSPIVKGIVGAFADVESMLALKDLWNRAFNSELLYTDGHPFSADSALIDLRANYIFNSGIREIEKADMILIIGSNPKKEAPILNARIRKAYLAGADVGLVGPQLSLNYEYFHIGSCISDLSFRKDTEFIRRFSQAKRPMIIVGSTVLEGADAVSWKYHIDEFIKTVPQLMTDQWKGYNVLQTDASRVGALDLGYNSQRRSVAKSARLVYLLNADNISASDIPEGAFVIYQGHHGDIGASMASLVLPGSAYTEKDATFINTEGRPQMTKAAVPPPMTAREDWKILRAISEILGTPLPYSNQYELRQRMQYIAPNIMEMGILQTSCWIPPIITDKRSTSPKNELKDKEFHLPITDYYINDPISRASVTMAKCSKAFN